MQEGQCRRPERRERAGILGSEGRSSLHRMINSLGRPEHVNANKRLPAPQGSDGRLLNKRCSREQPGRGQQSGQAHSLELIHLGCLLSSHISQIFRSRFFIASGCVHLGCPQTKIIFTRSAPVPNSLCTQSPLTPSCSSLFRESHSTNSGILYKTSGCGSFICSPYALVQALILSLPDHCKSPFQVHLHSVASIVLKHTPDLTPPPQSGILPMILSSSLLSSTQLSRAPKPPDKLQGPRGSLFPNLPHTLLPLCSAFFSWGLSCPSLPPGAFLKADAQLAGSLDRSHQGGTASMYSKRSPRQAVAESKGRVQFSCVSVSPVPNKCQPHKNLSGMFSGLIFTAKGFIALNALEL